MSVVSKWAAIVLICDILCCSCMCVLDVAVVVGVCQKLLSVLCDFFRFSCERYHFKAGKVLVKCQNPYDNYFPSVIKSPSWPLCSQHGCLLLPQTYQEEARRFPADDQPMNALQPILYFHF